MKRFWFVLLLLALVLALSVPALAQDGDGDERVASPEGTCSSPSGKKALVADYGEILELFGAGQTFLCTPSPTYFHNRTIGSSSVGFYYQLPFVRSASNLSTFCNNYSDWAGVVLFADAPTRTVAQGGTYQTAEQTGDLALGINSCAPWAQLIGPFSDPNVVTGADGVPSDWLYRMQQRYINGGGNVASWRDAGLLLYPDRFGGWTPESLLVQYSALMLYVTGDDPTSNVWSETRWGNTWANPAANMENLMDRIMNVSRTEKVFGFELKGSSLYQFRTSGGTITGSGTGYRNSGW